MPTLSRPPGRVPAPPAVPAGLATRPAAGLATRPAAGLATRPAAVLAALLAGLAAALLAGCARGPAGTSPVPATAGRTPTPATAPASGPLVPAATVVRSGGFAGRTEALRVDPDGAWEYSAGSQPVRHGRLTPAQRQRLTDLVAALAGDGTPPSAGVCPDGYRYSVTAGTARFTGTDCDLPAYPALAALVEFVTAATPM